MRQASPSARTERLFREVAFKVLTVRILEILSNTSYVLPFQSAVCLLLPRTVRTATCVPRLHAELQSHQHLCCTKYEVLVRTRTETVLKIPPTVPPYSECTWSLGARHVRYSYEYEYECSPLLYLRTLLCVICLLRCSFQLLCHAHAHVCKAAKTRGEEHPRVPQRQKKRHL